MRSSKVINMEIDKMNTVGVLTKFQKLICLLFKIPEPEPLQFISATMYLDENSRIYPTDLIIDNNKDKWYVNKAIVGSKCKEIKVETIKPIKQKTVTEIVAIGSVYKENIKP